MAEPTHYLMTARGQLYVTADGNLSSRTVEWPLGTLIGVSSITSFPSGVLPLAIVTTDECGRIIQLDDYRPA